MSNFEFSIEFDIPEPGDLRYEGTMCFEATGDFGAPTAPWRGSVHSCPSDIDWYGAGGEFQGWESVEIFDLTLTDKDGVDGGALRPANPDEIARLNKWVVGEGQSWFDQQVEKHFEGEAIDAAEDAAEARAEARMCW